MFTELPTEIVYHIIDQVSDGAMFKSLLLTCEMFYEYFYMGPKMLKVGEVDASMKYWMLVDRFSDHRLTRIKMFGIIAGDRDVPYEYVSGLSYHMLSRAPDLPLEYIKKYHKSLEMFDVSYHNRLLTVDFIRDTSRCRWSYLALTHNPVFTEDIIKNNPDIPWVLDSLYGAVNPSLTYKFIANVKGHGTLLTNYPANMEKSLVKAAIKQPNLTAFAFSLSLHLMITQEIVDSNPNFPWYKTGLSCNPMISGKFPRGRTLVGFSYLCKTQPDKALSILDNLEASYIRKASYHLPLKMIAANIQLFNKCAHLIIHRDDVDFSFIHKYFNKKIDTAAHACKIRLSDLDNVKGLHIHCNLHCSWIVYAARHSHKSD